MLQHSMAESSLIEYVAIPWDNYGEGCLTINLALFILNILVNEEGHELDWDYAPWRIESEQ